MLTIGQSGGGAKFATISPLASRQDIRRNIGFDAAGLDFTMGWDPDNATYLAMLALSRVTYRSFDWVSSGSLILWWAIFWPLEPFPTDIRLFAYR